MTMMPTSNRDQSLRKAGLAASVLTAVGASICCIGPIAAAVLGIASLGGLVRYEPLRPNFTVMTLALLAGAFYFTIEGMTCGACATSVKIVLGKIEGVSAARVSHEEKSAVVTYDPAKVTPQQLADTVNEKLPYKATVVANREDKQ